MPKISVIVPIYNVEKFISRCAISLLNQTLDDLELIFIDDCTLDSSMEVLKGVIENKPNPNMTIKIIRMPKNSGLPSVRKRGIVEASGEFILHCDSDDWVDIDMCRLMYEKAKQDDLDLVWCDYYRSDGFNHTSVSLSKQPKLMQGPIWNKLIKREVYINNEIDYPIANKAEDGALMTQLSLYSQKRGYIPKPLYYYYNNPDSICGRVSEEACLKKLSQEKDNVSLRINFLKNKGLESIFKKDVIIWKYECRKNLMPIIHEESYKKLWRNTYPEINKQILLSRDFTIRFKIRFLLSLINPSF